MRNQKVSDEDNPTDYFLFIKWRMNNFLKPRRYM